MNEYASTNKDPNGDFYSITQVMAFGMTSSGVSDDDSADAEISGVIKSIAHEVRGDDETGRLNVELISFGYNGIAEPFKFVVEEDLANDFESFYDLGASVKIYYEITTRQVGTVRTESSGGFGRRNAKIVSGYTVTEYSVFRGDEPFDEESEYYVDVDTVKNALQARDIMIANKIADAVKRASEDKKPTTNLKGSSNGKANPFGDTAPSNPFGGTQKKANPFA